MESILDDLLGQLEDDMLYHGWLVQCVTLHNETVDSGQLDWRNVLDFLLDSGKVEIGTTSKCESPKSVVFTAWTGSTPDRLSRAIESVETSSSDRRTFAYWLCLKGNADFHEDCS